MFPLPAVFVDRDRHESGLTEADLTLIKKITQPLWMNVCFPEVSTKPNVSVANRVGTRCMWAVSVQDVCVCVCENRLLRSAHVSGTIRGENAHVSDDRKRPCTCHTHILWPFCLTPLVPVLSPGLKVGRTEGTIGPRLWVCVCVLHLI